MLKKHEMETFFRKGKTFLTRLKVRELFMKVQCAPIENDVLLSLSDLLTNRSVTF